MRQGVGPVTASPASYTNVGSNKLSTDDMTGLPIVALGEPNPDRWPVIECVAALDALSWLGWGQSHIRQVSGLVIETNPRPSRWHRAKQHNGSAPGQINIRVHHESCHAYSSSYPERGGRGMAPSINITLL